MFKIEENLAKEINQFIEKEYVSGTANGMSACYVAFGCMDCSNYCAENCSNKCKKNSK